MPAHLRVHEVETPPPSSDLKSKRNELKIEKTRKYEAPKRNQLLMTFKEKLYDTIRFY